ncbi:MAG: tyrosine-type recombinase/integrase [Gammaproteobacteria bacterium]|nr:tyrosine-type recombinase/integrase [Gammaproteobacteria bacterium]
MNPQAALAQPQAAMPQAVTNRLAGALKASLSPNTSRAYRTAWAAFDLALASVMADAGLRRSEAALTFVTQAACDDAGRLRRLPGWPTDDAPMFAVRGQQPPAPQTIRNRIAATAKAAGLGEGYTGHSGRVGMAMRMTRNGAPAQTVARQGRWRTESQVIRYTKQLAATEARRYL